ncbi:MAG: phosphohydrolase [Spirochaetes bacterium]|nr:MAG: phosphohydrolase [Spirochaetota bacterium]
MTDEEKLREIIRLGSELNNIQDLDLLLERILLEARLCVNADAGTIYLKQGNDLVFTHAQNETLQKQLPTGQKLIYSIFKVPMDNRSIAGYVATTGEILNIPNVYELPESVPYRFNPSFDRLANYHTESVLTVPLKTPMGDILGVFQVINGRNESGKIVKFEKDHELFILSFASTASIVLQRAQMTRTLLLRMMQMAELRDPKETGAHVNRVASYAVEIYERWAYNKGIEQNELDSNRDILRMAAMLHDVGKVAISDLILKKPGRVTPEEFEVIKSHTYLGAGIFKERQSSFDQLAAEVALNHHENWDGTGYPGHVDIETGKPIRIGRDGKALPKKGEEIPIMGRIVSLADVYDALSSRRVYKEAWSETDVLVEIKKSSGMKFDPDIVDIFFENLNTLRSIQERYKEEEET